MSRDFVAFARTSEAPLLPPPANMVGPVGWLWRNVFSSMTRFGSIGEAIQSILMAVLTVAIGYFFVTQIWLIFQFTVGHAVFSDPDGVKRNVCLTEAAGGLLPNGSEIGACWPYVAAKWKQFIYGSYPDEQLWRVNLLFLIGGVGLVWALIDGAPYRKWVTIAMLTAYPVLAFVLLTGGGLNGFGLATWSAIVGLGFAAAGLAGGKGVFGEVGRLASALLTAVGAIILGFAVAAFLVSVDFGLTTVETSLWGGLLLTLVVAISGIVISLPLGVLLALGRRSKLPIVRALSVIYIELWRGVPLISVLFMSSIMLPLFMPVGTEVNKLMRVLIGVTLFSSAYMAEVVRGGLQAIPKGQYEGAMALGLPYWNMMRLIVMPQALVLVIPGIVNTFIGLFKDTTLVLIVGLFDLLGAVQMTFADNEWATPVTNHTGYLVAAAIFFIFCFGMSRYSMWMERKLRRGHAR